MALAHIQPVGDPDDFVDAVARNIKALLAIRGMKHQDLAKAIGMTPGKLSQRMGGHSRWLAVELHYVAQAFGVDTDVVFATDESAFREALARSRCSWTNTQRERHLVIVPTPEDDGQDTLF